MNKVNFSRAYYIKLGRGGKWEESSIQENKMRIGWEEWTTDEINHQDWEAIKESHQGEYKNKGSATMDINALRNILESTSDDIWITFHTSQLWWCRLGDNGIIKDEISKYRLLSGKWHNHDINGHNLLANQISGKIAKYQLFRAAVCTIGKDDVEILRRLINDEPSEVFKSISHAKLDLITEVEKGLTKLHWKDFETLVDLLFRNAGWRRVSLVGESMKYVDIELVEPVTGDRYQVQVKSKASIDDFDEYAKDFPHQIYRKLYFVVHTPDDALRSLKSSKYDNVELVLPQRIAEMVVELGLSGWLLTKIK